jgi:hypothetical protein
MLGGVTFEGTENAEQSDWYVFEMKAMAWIELFLSWVHDGGGQDWDSNFHRTLPAATKGRCYFQTDCGDQGLCYPSSQVGDKVWIINGLKVPLVLRRTHLSEDESSELRLMEAYGMSEDGVYGLRAEFERGEGGEEHYSLIDDCYSDGYMYGDESCNATRHVVLV